MRLAMLLLVLCVGAQGVALAAQRTVGRLHYHVPVGQHAGGGAVHGLDHPHVHAHPQEVDQRGEAHEDDEDDDHHHDDEQADDAADRQSPGAGNVDPRHTAQHHEHNTELADHVHAPDAPGVVHVAEGSHHDAPNEPAGPSRVHEGDGLPVDVALAVGLLSVRGPWLRQASPPIRSFISALPERPPSA
jgi:hypothetical protein